MANIYGRQVVMPMTNKSGGGVVAGDVVIIDTGNDNAFTTTTSGQYQGSIGIAQETIANNASGRVLVHGYAALVNVPSSMTRGRFLETHTVAKQATGNATRRAGSFGQFLTGGTTPTAWLWGFPDNAGAAGETVATSTIWDAAGDLVQGTGADAAARLALGSAGAYLGSTGSAAAWVGPLAFAQAEITSQTSNTTNAMLDITGATVTLTTGARRCRVSFVCWGENTGSGGGTAIAVLVDGTALDADGIAVQAPRGANVGDTLSATVLTAVLSAGSHTIKLQGNRTLSSGDSKFGSTTYKGYLIVEETPYTT